MTYLESYRKTTSLDELRTIAISDTKIAIFLGNNPDRIKAIEDAMNKVIEENGWDEVTE